MKHLIMGTAGHIDHGKTTLIQKLTGVDCDTHKEEKTRGITIQLGFTHFTLKSGDKIGIIDVPGHADFVNTMVSGASSIDFALLVISADEGIMPQTEEHLSIMKILGINQGLVVLTKIDLVDDELLELAEEEIIEFTQETFLEGSPIVKVSSLTGKGIEELKSAIESTIMDIQPRITKELFRLYIDRLFTVAGFGTIIAGTVRSGSMDKSTKLFAFPGYKSLRVRKIERYGTEVNELVAGDRGSLNLTGIDRDELSRGMLIADGLIQSTNMIDAKLKMFGSDSKLKVWSQCVFLHGTNQFEVKVHLLDKDIIASGEEAIVQIHFETPIYACYGDRYVIRNSSSDITLGGGEIIDVRPLHHKRRTKKMISDLLKVADGKLEELAASEVRKSLHVVSHKELITVFNVTEDEVMKIISESLPEDIVALDAKNVVFLTEKVRYEKLRNKIVRHLQTYHKHNPLEEAGKTLDELLGLFGKERNDKLEDYMSVVLKRLTDENKLKRVDSTWVLGTHKVILSDKLKADVVFVENYLEQSNMKVPLMSELLPAAQARAIDENTLFQILKLLVNRNKAYKIDDNYIHSSIVDASRIKLLTALKDKKEGMTVAEFRDLVNGNRKICLLLIARFDGEGITFRRGDYRTITEKGRKYLEENST